MVSQAAGTLERMIASRRGSQTHGPGRLVVDGRGATVVRKATFAFKPSRTQESRLRVCREVYNAALQERRDAWRLAGKTIRWQHQFTQIKDLRGIRDDALQFGIQPLRGAIMRVDEAMTGFFDRVKHGQTPGFRGSRARAGSAPPAGTSPGRGSWAMTGARCTCRGWACPQCRWQAGQ